jgi:hypothetical protein
MDSTALTEPGCLMCALAMLPSRSHLGFTHHALRAGMDYRSSLTPRPWRSIYSPQPPNILSNRGDASNGEDRRSVSPIKSACNVTVDLKICGQRSESDCKRIEISGIAPVSGAGCRTGVGTCSPILLVSSKMLFLAPHSRWVYHPLHHHCLPWARFW